MQTQGIKVWDIFIRVFHWTLVIGFITSYISGEEEAMLVHEYSGYYLLSIVCLRILWGFVGSKHARFSNFVFSFKEILQYTKSLLMFHSKRHIGHNPLGGLMILILLASLLLCTITGVLLLGMDHYTGILSFIGDWELPIALIEAVESTHKFASELLLVLIGIHLLGVFYSMFAHRENLIWSMVTGRKKI